MSDQVFKFRGCDNCYVAEVIKDDKDGITYGEMTKLFPLGEVGKSTSSDSAVDYADNLPLLIVNSEGNDEIVLTGFGISLKNLALITGKTFDEAKGALIEGARSVKYFALIYREKLTNGKYRYHSRLKGTFNIPNEGSATENDGTDSQGQEVTFTGIFTTHAFTNGGAAKAVVVDTQYEGANVEGWFEAPTTPDTVKAKA
jgi:phi13 family phage major tail protein